MRALRVRNDPELRSKYLADGLSLVSSALKAKRFCISTVMTTTEGSAPAQVTINPLADALQGSCVSQHRDSESVVKNLIKLSDS